MKKVVLFAVSCLMTVLAFAKNDAEDPKYGIGSVPVENGKVTFKTSIPLPEGADIDLCYQRVLSWAKGYFASASVRSGAIIAENSETRRFVFNVEQTLVFKRSALEIDESIIVYNFSVNFNNNACNITVSDIKYRYEMGRESGGSTFTAEDWITDDEAFNRKKTKFLKQTGKFRIKTIDLKDKLYTLVEDVLNSK